MQNNDKAMPEKQVNDLLKRIGGKIRELRKALEPNYELFSRKHHINKVTLQRIESGQNFTFASLLQVLKALDISLHDFFSELEKD